MTITSPPSGAHVRGAVTVSASVSGAGSGSVAGVQFKLDGVSLGAEDTTAPYSVSWDTTTGSEGWHTLTAVARDAGGGQSSSEPVKVTVSNSPPPSAPVTRHEETDASVTYSAGWTQESSLPWSGGSSAYARTPGARATFTFTGTSVTWIGYRSGFGGIARVFVDGVFVSDVDLFAKSADLRVPVFTMTGLTNSTHALTIEVTGRKNQDSLAAGTLDTVVVVDAFDVPAVPVSRLQNTDPAITYSAGWAGEDLGKTQWSALDATVSSTPGAQATLTFSGTSINWIGYRGPDTGTARVYLDGVLASEIDTYSPIERVQDNIFTATGLADASHTLTIEVTGLKNDASTGALVAVDAFDVTSSGTRFEETDWSVAYTGNWAQNNRNHPWSQGSIAASNAPGSQVTFTFTGTSVNWIGRRGPWDAIARVYLDGVFVAEVDNYAPTQGYQNTVFTASGLADTSHTLAIEVTGRKNAASTLEWPWVVVDAFDVRRPARPTTASTPFTGTPSAIPGTFAAEDFDLGGEGVAYHDNTPGNQGGQYRTAEDVDIVASSDPEGGGYVVNNFETGEWLAYTVNVTGSARYDVELRVSSALSNSAFHVEIDGVNVTGSIPVPNTGSWSAFQWVGKKGVSLAAGQHVLKIVTDQQFFNLNSVRVLPSASSTTRSEESVATYTGTWTSYGAETGSFSGGTVVASPNAMNTASFTFTGTAVTWIGVKCSLCGIATVSIDGGAPATVNTAGPASGNLTSEPVFSASGLDPAATHTMVITVTGTTTSGGAHIAVDAFDVTR